MDTFETKISSWIDNLNAHVAEHRRRLDIGDPDGSQQVIDRCKENIQYLRNVLALYAETRDPNNYAHAFKTFMGLPPDTTDKPVCGADLAANWSGAGKPVCPVCQQMMAGNGSPSPSN